MNVSVVIRSKDEADRLRLVLASLRRQTRPAEVVVVDDGSKDHTPEVLAEASREMSLHAIRHASSQGRSAASNAGAAAARGDILLFLDGDTLAHPNLVERHAASHAAGLKVVVRGETWHLRCTRPLMNPETGALWPGAEDAGARLSPRDLARAQVTRRQVEDDFGTIEARAQPGVYPGAGPRRLLELEMDALRSHPDCDVLWAAAAGSNLSVRRSFFLGAGGFDERLTINEHRELALRLCRSGARMTASEARTFHLIHRSGWRDPLIEADWEATFFDAHPLAAVALLSVFWKSLAGSSGPPGPADLATLPDLAAAAARYGRHATPQAVRDAHSRWAAEREAA